MVGRHLVRLPTHIWAHVLRDTPACEVVRLAHMSRALHERIMGTALCQCAQDPIDGHAHPVGKSDFWVHWRDYGTVTDDRLAECCQRGHLACVRVLLALGCNPAHMGQRALLHACIHENLNVVREWLRDERVDPSRKEGDILRFACSMNQHRVVEVLLADPRANPCAEDHVSIQVASQNGYVDVVALLLRDGRADPRADRQYALRAACFHGHTEVVALLLCDGRVDPSAEGQVALLTACQHGHVGVAEMLLRDGRVDPSVDGQRMIQTACMFGHVDVVDRLLNDRRVDARNCLRVAIDEENLDGRQVVVIKRLLREPNMDVTYNRGEPMRWACRHGLVSVVELLLAFPQIRSDCCAIRRAIETATRGGHVALAQRLYRHLRTVPYHSCSMCSEHAVDPDALGGP